MVAFVEHHQAEARPHVIHVQKRRVVRGDGERAQVVLPSPHEPDRAAKREREEVVPLPHEIERGGDDQGVTTFVVDREHREVTLAGARREYDDPAPARSLPRGDGLGLVRARLPVNARAFGELAVTARAVLVRNFARDERAHDVRVRERGRTVTARSLVPRACRRERRDEARIAFEGDSADLERARDEREHHVTRRKLSLDRRRHRTVLAPRRADPTREKADGGYIPMPARAVSRRCANRPSVSFEISYKGRPFEGSVPNKSHQGPKRAGRLTSKQGATFSRREPSR
jgi:hypothetical protein